MRSTIVGGAAWALVALAGMIGCGDGATTAVSAEDASAADGVPSEDTEGDAASSETAGDAPADALSVESKGETSVDLDGDGLDDAYEDRVAREYLPYLSVDDADGCPRSAIVWRLRKHPDAATRLLLVVDNLFEKDCGAMGHPGDNEVFGVTIDPSRPAPEGILAVRAISHQNTACEAKTDCGSCGGLTACATAMRNGKPFPIVWYSKGKHGAYMSEAKCDGACFFTNQCTLAKAETIPKMINVGEPEKQLVNNLTAAGLITVASGWTEVGLMNFDPWSGKNFGGAGNVADDLVDPAFVTPACP